MTVIKKYGFIDFQREAGRGRKKDSQIFPQDCIASIIFTWIFFWFFLQIEALQKNRKKYSLSSMAGLEGTVAASKSLNL